jgi:thiamine biosynthesis lipoprotein
MKATWMIMGMPISLEALGPRVTPAALDAVRDWLTQVDQTFSTYKPDSEISRLNRGELKLAAVSAAVQEVLAECQRLQQLTQGYFDIQRGDIIDPSGYVKGWAIKKGAELLEEHQIWRYCLEAGGDMQLRGPGPTDGPWKIGITHPLQPTRLAKVLYVAKGAVATSGTYKRGRHIYNPLTGQEVSDPISLTVIGASIDRVDALTTAAFCMGVEGLEFLHRQGWEAMMVRADGRVVLTPGFGRYEHPSGG